MIIGDPALIALESEITRALPVEDRFRALGFFVLHVGGKLYGVREPSATLLECSINEVEERIKRQGTHFVPFVREPAGKIADAFRDAIYAPDQEEKEFFGYPFDVFESMIYKSHMIWAPDGDEAFDDRSYVLQFDTGSEVRIIAFRSKSDSYHHDPATLSDVWIGRDQFYGILGKWRAEFANQWSLVSKIPAAT
jgi:hypothetical protein